MNTSSVWKLAKEICYCLIAGFVVFGFARIRHAMNDRNGVPVGRVVDSLEVIPPLARVPVRIRLSGRSTVLLVFDDACAVCHLQLPAWMELTRRLGHNVRILAVSLEPASAGSPFRADSIIEYLGVARASSLKGQFGFHGTPMTVALDAKARILLVRNGLNDLAGVDSTLSVNHQ